MKTTNNIKNQMRPFSDTSIYDDKPVSAKETPVAKDEAPAEDIEATTDEAVGDETANEDTAAVAEVMEMSEASQLAIYDALKAKFDISQETGADNSKF